MLSNSSVLQEGDSFMMMMMTMTYIELESSYSMAKLGYLQICLKGIVFYLKGKAK